MNRLLAFFQGQKAFYEVNYVCAHTTANLQKKEEEVELEEKKLT